jgi:hypothetical protein
MTSTLTRTGKLFDSSDRIRLDTYHKQSTSSPPQCHLMIEIKQALTDLSIFYARDSLPCESHPSALSDPPIEGDLFHRRLGQLHSQKLVRDLQTSVGRGPRLP